MSRIGAAYWRRKELVRQALALHDLGGDPDRVLTLLEAAHRLDTTDVGVLLFLVQQLDEMGYEAASRRLGDLVLRLALVDPTVRARAGSILCHGPSPASSPPPLPGSHAALEAGLARESLLAGLRTEEITYLQATVAFAFDRFGLPNGVKNRGTRRGHRLRPPAQREILDSLREVVRLLLEPDEQWLLEVPTGFADAHAAHSVLYLDESGCAVVLFPGLFGGLFYANERISQLGRVTAPARTTRRSKPGLGELIAHLLHGQGDDAEVALATIGSSRGLLDSGLNEEIWRTSTIQIVFVLLHEYGHVVIEAGRDRSRGGGLARRSFAGTDDELAADAWAARKIARGIPGACLVTPLRIDEAIRDLFGLLELARPHERHAEPTNRILPVERWLHVAPILDPEAAAGAEFEQRTRRAFARLESSFFRDA